MRGETSRTRKEKQEPLVAERREGKKVVRGNQDEITGSMLQAVAAGRRKTTALAVLAVAVATTAVATADPTQQGIPAQRLD